MFIHYLLFAVYLLGFIWYIPKVSFIKNSGLKSKEIKWLIVLKLATGIIGAFYFYELYHNADYLSYNNEGKLQYEMLLSNPILFFTDFKNDINTYGLGGVFNSSYSFWANFRFLLLFKFIAIINVISGGNFYFNSVIFCSLIFFGHVAFYRIYNTIYAAGPKLLKILVCFFLPSLLLYTSCVHKDGFVFLSLGVVSYIFFRLLENKKSLNFKKAVAFCIGILCIFLFRNFVLIALLPAMLTACLTQWLSYKKRWIVAGSYLLYSVLFFLTGMFNNSLNLLAAVVKRKADFALLEKGSTNIEMNELYPNAISFIKNIPMAFNHFFLRPYLWEFSDTGAMLAALEIFVYMGVMIAFFVFVKKPFQNIHPYNIYAMAFVFSMVLIIGYTIPNVGALVRYRCIFWIFLLCPLVCSIDWNKISFHRRKDSHL